MRRAAPYNYLRLLSILMTGACLASCASMRTTPIKTEAAPIIAPDIQAFARGWQAYTGEVNQIPRHADCAPRFLTASPEVQRQGAVIMFHGFSGCPQQFFELGERVAEQGFDVLLPVLPGHGVLSAQDDTDNLSLLPGAQHSEYGYAELARRMNGIMARSPGTRVIVGFSLGGAISLNASLRASELYDRQLLLSPMLAIWGGPFVEGLAEILGRIPGLRNIIVKPSAIREKCRGWQSSGRAGFCDYRYRHVVPLLELEDQNRDIYGRVTLTNPIQIVGAGDEHYISNDQLVSLTERQKQNGPISLCIMPDDVAHEMLSSYENVGREMYWLNDLLNDAVAFIVDAEFFPSAKNPDQDADTGPRCRISSTPTQGITSQRAGEGQRWPA